jgi:signal peptidase
MGKLIYKIFTKIILGILVLFLIIVGIYVSKRVITKDPTSSVFGFSFYRVATGSMKPDINPGDLVVVKSKNEYRIGMDVTYRINKNSTPVTHRIVDIDGDIVTTEGIEGSIIVFGDETDRSYEICVLLSKLIMLELNIT